jgi:predicted esterase
MTRTLFIFAVITVLLPCTTTRADGPQRPARPAPTGRFQPTFSERSPLTNVDELRRRRDLSRVGGWPMKPDYDLATQSFVAYVPPSYRPNVPHGLIVWISPGPPDVEPAWFDVLARHKLIWVSPDVMRDNTGLIRIGLPIDGVHNMKARYNIDDERIYVAGFSGGGLHASELVHIFPDVFRGAFCLNGEDFYGGMRKAEDGRLEPGADAFMHWVGPLDPIKRDLRLVILTGEKDPINEPEISRANYESLVLDGFERVTFLQVPNGVHQHPSAAWFEKGINALDHTERATPPTTSPTADPDPLPGQVAQAHRLLSTAQANLDDDYRFDMDRKFKQNAARDYLQQIVSDYPTTPSAAPARELLAWMDRHNLGHEKLPRRPNAQ